MGTTISVEQRFSLLAKLGENIDWESLTKDQVQAGIREAQRAGAEATAFILNGFRIQVGDFFRETGEVTIAIPALPRPTLEELRGKFDWIKSIERDMSPTEAVTLRLGTVLRPGENSINGQEYECRLASVTGLLGYQQLQWLVDHQDEHTAFKVLLGKIYIDGPGLVVVLSDGCRDFPCLDGVGGRWRLPWRWVGGDLGGSSRIAVSGK